MRVLIVEDDGLLRDGLTVGLGLMGFNCEAVETLADAETALGLSVFDAVVLDVMLPDGSGIDLLRRVRGRGDLRPVLLLTARDGLSDRIEGLDAGADDHLGKPFELSELAARLRAILRRAEGRAAAQVIWNGLTLDPAQMAGRMDGTAVSFTRREFALLSALLQNPGTILARPVLEERLYGWQEDIESNAVEVHIHNLRQKLGARYIETVRGVGYRVAGERP